MHRIKDPQILGYKELQILGFKAPEILWCKDPQILGFKDAQILEFKDPQILGFKDSQILRFKDHQILGFKDPPDCFILNHTSEVKGFLFGYSSSYFSDKIFGKYEWQSWAFGNLTEDNDFADVILACEDG